MDKEDMEFEEHVGSLKEQAQQYTKKLKKLYASYQTKKSEREGLRKEFQVRGTAQLHHWSAEAHIRCQTYFRLQNMKKR